MNIGQASSATGVSTKMIRHYEAIGLLPKAARAESGYRRYQAADLHLLRFVRQARTVGFSTTDIRQLLALWQDRRRPAREVKRLAQRHLDEVELRIGELKAIAGTLTHLIAHCRGNDRPDCPILDALADEGHAHAGSGKPPQREAPRRRSRHAPGK
jgi:MerR family copper efflux transcriptional regulator